MILFIKLGLCSCLLMRFWLNVSLAISHANSQNRINMLAAKTPSLLLINPFIRWPCKMFTCKCGSDSMRQFRSCLVSMDCHCFHQLRFVWAVFNASSNIAVSKTPLGSSNDVFTLESIHTWPIHCTFRRVFFNERDTRLAHAQYRSPNSNWCCWARISPRESPRTTRNQTVKTVAPRNELNTREAVALHCNGKWFRISAVRTKSLNNVRII